MDRLPELMSDVLPSGVRGRYIMTRRGLDMHILEAGFEGRGRPLVLLLHGFPELAYSWRKVMVPLAAAGFHVVAPDQRGYGRTTGWSAAYDQDLKPFSMLQLASDIVALTYALNATSVAAVVGHDFGSPVAAWCALARPDLFRSVVMMSAPFAGTPRFDAAAPGRGTDSAMDIVGLAGLPRPRKHYQVYYATREANADLTQCPQGIAAFLRAYFHFKSADWEGNRPYRLGDGSAEQLALMPTYYIMDAAATMSETVAPEMPSSAMVAGCRWLTEAELAVYAAEFRRTGFQGGLNWYRARFERSLNDDLALYANRTIDVDAMFLAGKSDWGVYQVPGAYESMAESACTRMRACALIEGAGHWVMQEQPEAVVTHLLAFLRPR